MNNNQPVINVVDPIARLYGVPTGIWETVVQVESGFNPQAVGDNGTSFGLFQLHQGGQLGNLTEQQAFDPATNARTALPSIAAAWRQLKGGNPNTLSFWQQFASISGHPAQNGNIYDSAVQNEADQLYAAYKAQNGLTDNGSSTTINQNVSLSGGIGGSSISSILSSIGGKIALFALAVLLLIVGLMALAGKENLKAAGSAVAKGGGE